MSLAGSSSASGSLLAQWLKNPQAHEKGPLDWRTYFHFFDGRSFFFLIGLGMTWSAWVEAPLYQAIEQFHFSSTHLWVHIVNALMQTGFDFFIFSILFATPAAIFVYAIAFHPKDRTAGLKEIREKLIGFYVYYEWRWAVWIFFAMLICLHATHQFYFLSGRRSHLECVSFEAEEYPDSAVVDRPGRTMPVVRVVRSDSARYSEVFKSPPVLPFFMECDCDRHHPEPPPTFCRIFPSPKTLCPSMCSQEV